MHCIDISPGSTIAQRREQAHYSTCRASPRGHLPLSLSLTPIKHPNTYTPMFKLLGADQKEYGPVSADQIRQWIAQGRANGQTRAQAAESTDWKPLAEFPEFADALRAAASPAGQPPPTPGSPPPPPPKTSGLAITSLVLGCLGLLTCGITSLVGLILGIVALVRINKSKGQLGGQGLALAGTIVSAAFLLFAAHLRRHAPARAGQGQTEGPEHPMHEQRQAAQPRPDHVCRRQQGPVPRRHALVRRTQALRARIQRPFSARRASRANAAITLSTPSWSDTKPKRSGRRPRPC